MIRNQLLTKIDDFEKSGLIEKEDIVKIRTNLSINKLSMIIFIKITHKLMTRIVSLENRLINQKEAEKPEQDPKKTKK